MAQCVVFFFLLLHSAHECVGQRTIAANNIITGSQHWFLSDSPVHVQGTLTVGRGGSLIIDAGVIVKMAVYAVIRNQNILGVEGTAELPVWYYVFSPCITSFR